MLALCLGWILLSWYGASARRARALALWFLGFPEEGIVVGAVGMWESPGGRFPRGGGNGGKPYLGFPRFPRPRHFHRALPTLPPPSGVLNGTGCYFGAPTARAALEQVAVVEQAVEHSAAGGGIAQQLPPILDRAV